jgi:pimeloyl-ACP methyl ester carboxylesterase
MWPSGSPGGATGWTGGRGITCGGAARLQLPILLFQGTADQKVPAATSDELARLAHDVTYVRVAGADHLDSWNLDPAHYNRAVQAFVERILGSSAA